MAFFVGVHTFPSRKRPTSSLINYSAKEKLCSMCKAWLPFAAYHQLKKAPFGLRYACKVCEKALRKRYPETEARNIKTRRKRLQEIVFTHYGNKCNCCAYTGYMFLTIDHVNNDGYKTAVYGRAGKRKARPAIEQVYRTIIKNKFPNSYQLLCWNCNCAKYRNGGVCPHQEMQ